MLQFFRKLVFLEIEFHSKISLANDFPINYRGKVRTKVQRINLKKEKNHLLFISTHFRIKFNYSLVADLCSKLKQPRRLSTGCAHVSRFFFRFLKAKEQAGPMRILPYARRSLTSSSRREKREERRAEPTGL